MCVRVCECVHVCVCMCVCVVDQLQHDLTPRAQVVSIFYKESRLAFQEFKAANYIKKIVRAALQGPTKS